MRRKLLALGVLVAFELALVVPLAGEAQPLPAPLHMFPATADEPLVTMQDLQGRVEPAARVTLPSLPSVIDPTSIVQRYVPRPAGVEKDLTFFFGPFEIQPGSDLNRINVDVPVNDGFIVAIAPNLIDAVTGKEPSMLDAHIHHAHWFRLSDDPSDDYYTLNLAWVFGTGEEKTQGSLNERSAAQPGGPRYGIFIPGDQPQVMVFMIHNKVQQVQNLYITLSVRFVSGTASAIAAAQDCGPLPLLAGETCSAGQTFHELKGKLWGSTFDVPRQANGDDNYVYPPGQPDGVAFTASASGTAIATAGHLHPNGKEVVIVNEGKAGSGCEADLDHDGFPGVTLFHSRKLEHVQAAWPHSEDYQMAATQFGWRAPIHAGDRIAQFGVYSNKDYASYQAMSYAGFYVDRAQAPPAAQPGCALADYAPHVVGGSAQPAVEGILNHAWTHDMPLCGLPGYAACDVPVVPRTAGLETPVVAISAFTYAPGDQNGVGVLGDPPVVHVGQSLTFVNTDTSLGAVRHTVTSCAFPCNGPYVANYPQPDGRFDSGKLGNLDYIDGGITGSDTVPVWHSPTDLAPGLYTYYCRIHPRMRGAFEVVP